MCKCEICSQISDDEAEQLWRDIYEMECEPVPLRYQLVPCGRPEDRDKWFDADKYIPPRNVPVLVTDGRFCDVAYWHAWYTCPLPADSEPEPEWIANDYVNGIRHPAYWRFLPPMPEVSE